MSFCSMYRQLKKETFQYESYTPPLLSPRPILKNLPFAGALALSLGFQVFRAFSVFRVLGGPRIRGTI